MESALSRYYLDTLKTSTEQWQKRNSGNTISGSGFAKCLRLCYYRWFDTNREHKDPAFGDKLDITSQRNMFHGRSEEHTSELQSLMRISYAVFCLQKKTK